MSQFGFRRQSSVVKVVFAWLALVCCSIALTPMARAAGDPAQGPGGPILVVTSGTANYGKYYAEILRTEGLNSFAVTDAASLSASQLAAYDVVVLAKTALSPSQVSMLTTWVNAGGNLIAMAPDPALGSLLGLTPLGTTLSNGYLLVDTGTRAGNGIVGQTIQYHGAASLYSLAGAASIATLYSTATAATPYPAVTLASAGSGKAAAFAYELADSVVTTRQGNPAWATQERDGFAPIRSDDKFFGAAASDPQPNWVDLSKVAIPQADEQQRLLANLILQMNASKKPLPRFWYLPNGKKAAVIMSGDDHGNGGTAGRFDQFKAASPAGCSVANWECVRGTSYIYTSTPLSDSQAAQYNVDGFEVGLHINTGCADFTRASLDATYTQQVADWKAKYLSLPAPVTQRHHCIVWSDWSSGAEVQFTNGMRLDTSYYFWPPSWVNNVPGVFTGSAMPMRFMRLDGAFVDVYMAASQMTDESGQVYPFTINTLLDRALGPEGYYGVYTVNAHTDAVSSVESDAVVSSAQARGVPIVSSRQMLTWLDARNSSSFGAFTWNGTTLGFALTRDPAANGLQAMLPTRSGTGVLTGITRGTTAVPFTVSAVKGVEYAFFSADPGTYAAAYGVDSTAPLTTLTSPANGSTGVSTTVRPAATFGEAMDASSFSVSSFELRDASSSLISASVSYDAVSRTVTLTPIGPLAGSTTYTATVRGGASDPRAKDAAGNALVGNVTWSFTTGAAAPPPTCPCGAFGSSATPANASVADPNAIELGVKFTADVNGSVNGIRFYKGTGNTGTHIANLWSSSGTLLATATFVAESATGWQQVNFTTPVAVTANTVYVASYFTPAGNYAADSAFFASTGLDNPPVHLLRDGVSGGNGVYNYGPASAFPASTYNATNYWVDVSFTPAGSGPPDTVPPTVVANSPVNGATNVAPGATVSATFSESIALASIGTATFEIRTPANALVAGSVSYVASTNNATFIPNVPLAASTTYTVTLRGGSTDPRIKDTAGNALAANVSWSFTTGAAAGSCAAPPNAVVAENCLTGNPATEWDVSGSGDASIQGYATQISVNRGSTVSFKVNTNAAAYRFDIYRMGYYGGMGARKVASVTPSAALPQAQPGCLSDAATGLVDCGNWAVSGSWAVPANAVSGIYFARVVRTDTAGASHIVFVVRDDAGSSDLLFQTSDTTWQAYNEYGGNSLYVGSPVGRAYKVSYNRPFTTRAVAGGQDWVFNAEYPMVRWLESNGYNVSYFAGIDADRSGSLMLNHKAFLSVGHDEYWSGGQRANVEAARNAGVNLAFFSGNEVFWKTRWENSIDGSATPYRTLVSYKETHANAKIDPTPAWTGTWRDPRFTPPADGGRPENALTGTVFMNNDTGVPYAITVPEADGKMRLWRNTSVAALTTGQVATLPTGTLGYEWDADLDNGFRPAGLFRMSSTSITSSGMLLDQGSTYGQGTVNHALTLYKHASGARVFGAGTIQWTWGLDATHDRGSAPADVRMQQATVNLLADMGVQPGTLQSSLVTASPTTDAVAPVSTIVSPLADSTVTAGSPISISGTASDTGGGVVGGVEVSVDGGGTWHPAVGRASWTYAWTPSIAGTAVIKSRAVDDSGNIEAPSAGVTTTVGAQTCPCTIWSPSAAPVNASDPDTGAVNLGVKFRADANGFITGLRFYKGTGNTGSHIGTLWTSGGAQLATATFAGETASGWQQVNFATPVAITANTVYVASYLAPNGHYAGDNSVFTAAGVDNPPLHALQDGSSGGNGVYAYAATTTFPINTYQASNYWVDVVFSPTAADTTPPTVTAIAPASGATAVSPTTTVTATFSEAMDATTITATNVQLRTPSNTLVAATVGYNASTRVVTLTPSAALSGTTAYTATITTGVKDLAGNAMAANSVWTFTTAVVDTTPPVVSAISPANGATGVAAAANVTATFSEAMTASTIGASTFELRTAANAIVPAAVSYVTASNIATLNPTANLTEGQTYTAIVYGGATDPRVKDSAGNAMAANRTWSFTVAAIPPTVTAISPASGAVLVSRTANVTATFSETMDASTINTGTVELRNSGGTLIASVVTYNAATRVVTLNPNPTLAALTGHTVTIRGGTTDPRVKDAAGIPMAANRTWSFTTGF